MDEQLTNSEDVGFVQQRDKTALLLLLGASLLLPGRSENAFAVICTICRVNVMSHSHSHVESHFM
jgi:hypothetical protein